MLCSQVEAGRKMTEEEEEVMTEVECARGSSAKVTGLLLIYLKAWNLLIAICAINTGGKVEVARDFILADTYLVFFL